MAAAASAVTAAPTITVANNKAAIASATGGAVVRYTLDGSDPRYSDSAKVYSAAVDVHAGDRVRACACTESGYASAVTDKTV